MIRQLYRIIGILFLAIVWLIVISQINNKITENILIETNNNITNEVVENNNLTGKYDFVSEIWQLAFNYDTDNYIITESKVQEGSMIILTLSKNSVWKIGNIWVFHNGGHSQIPRDGFWVDEARSVAMTQNLSWICLEMPPGLRDYCIETKTSNNIFYVVVDGVYRKRWDETEYPKKQRYLQNSWSEFLSILFTTEEVWLQYTGLLQSIVDSIIFFDVKQSDKKTYYGDGITFQYPSSGSVSWRASWFDEISFLTWDKAEWYFRVEYDGYTCNNLVVQYKNQNKKMMNILTGMITDLESWCFLKQNIAITSSTYPIKELVHNIDIQE